MSVTRGYILEPFDASSPYFDDVVHIYLEAFGGEENAIRAFIARYATTLPDWRGYVALIGPQVVGMGFGTRSLPGLKCEIFVEETRQSSASALFLGNLATFG